MLLIVDGRNNVDVKSCDTGPCVNLTINSALIRISSKCCSSDYCNNATGTCLKPECLH